MARTRTYSDAALASAVLSASSWRGTLRELGLVATSASALRSVRSRADHLGIDYSHFRGQRRWSDAGLREAVASSDSWSAVALTLGVDGDAALSALEGHAVRLKLDTEHLLKPLRERRQLEPQMLFVDRAGSMLAAAWFTLCGARVSWPLEPCRYDLTVDDQGQWRRVQVKTTTTRAGESWKVYLSTSSGERRPYTPSEIDEFFVIDGDLNYYRIPIEEVGGLHAIHLSAYQSYRVPQRT